MYVCVYMCLYVYIYMLNAAEGVVGRTLVSASKNQCLELSLDIYQQSNYRNLFLVI